MVLIIQNMLLSIKHFLKGVLYGKKKKKGLARKVNRNLDKKKSLVKNQRVIKRLRNYSFILNLYYIGKKKKKVIAKIPNYTFIYLLCRDSYFKGTHYEFNTVYKKKVYVRWMTKWFYILLEPEDLEEIKTFTNISAKEIVPLAKGHSKYFKNPYIKNKKKRFKKKAFCEFTPSYDNKRLGAFEVENYCDCDLFLFTEKMKLNFLKKIFRELKKIQRAKVSRGRGQIYKYFYTQCMGYSFRVKHRFSKPIYSNNKILELK